MKTEHTRMYNTTDRQCLHDTQLAALTRPGAAAPIVTKSQVFVLTQADTLDDIELLIPDPQQRLDLFNYALALTQFAERRKFMLDDTRKQSATPVDLLAVFKEVTAKL